jgi:hypothetical protein
MGMPPPGHAWGIQGSLSTSLMMPRHSRSGVRIRICPYAAIYIHLNYIINEGIDFFKYDNCDHKFENGKYALNIRGASFEGEDAHPINNPNWEQWGGAG